MATERGGKEAPTCRTPQQQHSKGREDGWKKNTKVRKAAVLSCFWDFVRKLETRAREGDEAGFYKPLKTMNPEGKRDPSSAYVKDEDGVILRDAELIRKRWVQWIRTLLNAKSPKLRTNIAEGLDQLPEIMPLRIQPTMQELTGAMRALATGKAVGPDGVSVELFKINLHGDTALRRRLLDIVVCIWGGGGCRCSGKMPSSWYSIKTRIGQSAATTGAYRW